MIKIGAKKRRKKRKRNELRFGENETLTLKNLDGPGKFYQGFPAAVTIASRGMEHPPPAC